MYHFTMDGFLGFRSRFDDIRLVHELMEELPATLDVQPAMPPYVLPYYNGVIAEDCGISAFVLLAGGHLTIHTFSFRECFFADLVYPERYDARKLRLLLESGFPCQQITVANVERATSVLVDGPTSPDADFGPHLFLDIQGYRGPRDMDGIFTLFDGLPPRIDMTPIMRPYVIKGHTPQGEPVISALTMIAESHIAMHVYPERDAAFFDIFSCRFFDREAVTRELLSALPGERVTTALVSRGRQYSTLRREREPEMMRAKAWLNALASPDR